MSPARAAVCRWHTCSQMVTGSSFFGRLFSSISSSRNSLWKSECACGAKILCCLFVKSNNLNGALGVCISKLHEVYVTRYSINENLSKKKIASVFFEVNQLNFWTLWNACFEVNGIKNQQWIYHLIWHFFSWVLLYHKANYNKIESQMLILRR